MSSSTSDRYPDALRVGTALGEFTITDVIGEGGFGTVYLAYEETLDRTVAIKEYLPVAIAARSGDQTVLVRSEGNRKAYAAGLQSFMREARLQARFSHPAMLEVYRVWEQNGTAYMAMRYYPGESLRELRRNTASSITIDEAWIKRILLPVFDAVHELHSQSVLHRDVSPDNILILPSGAPVLLDFGAARMVVAGAAQSLTTVLKPGYAPIEQYAGDGALEQGPWTDVYGLGAVLYFLVIGNPPPQAVTRMMQDTLRGFDERVAGRYSSAFAAGIKQALAVRPENRLQSVTSLIDALGWNDAIEKQPATILATNVALATAEAVSTAGSQAGHEPATPLPDVRTTLLADANVSDGTYNRPTAPVALGQQRVTTALAPSATVLDDVPPLPATPPMRQTSSGARSVWRTGVWLLTAMLLLSVTYFLLNHRMPDGPAKVVTPSATDTTPIPSTRSDSAASPAAPPSVVAAPPVASPAAAPKQDTAEAATVPPPPTAAERDAPAPKNAKPKVAGSVATQAASAKSSAVADVPATRSGCERIFAKLSLGTAELTEVERQKLAACK